MIEDMRTVQHPADHDLAGQIEHLMNNLREMSLPPLQ